MHSKTKCVVRHSRLPFNWNWSVWDLGKLLLRVRTSQQPRSWRRRNFLIESRGNAILLSWSFVFSSILPARFFNSTQRWERKNATQTLAWSSWSNYAPNVRATILLIDLWKFIFVIRRMSWRNRQKFASAVFMNKIVEILSIERQCFKITTREIPQCF